MLRSKRTTLLWAGVIVCALSATKSAFAQVVEVDPFAGEWIEGFEAILPGGYNDLPVLQPNSDTEGLLGTMTFAFITSASTLGGSTVVAHKSVLFAHSTSPFEISFSTPIHQFGAYLATNSGASGGTVRFFDVNDQLIATMPLDVTFAQGIAPYTWNGWSSAVPFTRMTISSNGLLQGFLGIDDMQAIVVPAPASSMIMLLVMIVGCGGRWRGLER